MNSRPGVKQTLELVDRLKAVVTEFAASEEKLAHEFRLKFSRERQHREEVTFGEAQRFAAEAGAAEAEFQAGKEAAEAKYDRLKARINRARASSKEQALERIEYRTGTRKYELQKLLMESERNRDAGFAATVTMYQDFGANLAGELATLDALETKARGSFRGYGAFVRLISRALEKAQPNLEPDENKLLEELRNLLRQTDGDLDRFRGLLIPRLFSFLPLWLLLPLCAGTLFLQYSPIAKLSQPAAIGIASGSVVVVLALYFLGKSQGQTLAGRITDTLAKARKIQAACQAKSEASFHRENERIKNEFIAGTETIDADLKNALKEAGSLRGTFREQIDDKTVRVTAKNEQNHRVKIEELELKHRERLVWLQQAADTRKKEIVKICDARDAKLNAEREAVFQKLETDWRARSQPIYDAIASANAGAEKLFPPWSAKVLGEWTPARTFEHVAKFANLEVDVNKLCDAVPKDPRLALPGPAQFNVPLLLTYPEQGSILFETGNTGRESVIGALNNIILRLLATAPPGRLSFTIVDPVGLGQNFAGAMHLADYGEQLINSRIWTQAGQIEQRLGELNEHMEKVIQMYLRNEYETIAQYNEAAGNIAERYQFLVVADFPTNFSEVAAKRLLSIAASGARCGVYTLIHWDHRHPVPQDFVPEELRKSSVAVSARGNEIILTGKAVPGTTLSLDAPPSPELATDFIHQVGRASRDSSRVEVPFQNVVPSDKDLWSEETTSELRVAIGRTGATKLQYFAIGKGTRQHALIAGKTGSGKSTLFHVMITNLALWCSPEQVEFYLVDFKKGVEFKCYAAKRLPHARVVAIESDREFGLSVLQRVDDELKRRGDMFRKLGVQDIAGYKRAGGTEPIPRSLLMIDEFQELFVEDDKISQGASVLLDRIVRQGRAFGIHVVLGSQTLGGAYTVARTTLGQMVIRIALMCNEADAYLIMDDSNPAPRLLTRPGEGIYNDMAGALEGNSPFQTVWLSDQVRDEYLDKVRTRAIQGGIAYAGPLVYEGDAPADVRENHLLQGLLEVEAIKQPASPRLWLGAPNSIKGPTEAVFHRQSGNNLLIVGQRDEAALAMLSIGLVALAAQYPRDAAKFVLFDGTPPGSSQREFLEKLVAIIPHPVTLAKSGDLAEIMNGLAADMKQRAETEHGSSAPATFLLFHGLQKHNKLRHEDDFGFSGGDDAAASPAAQLNQLICEGTSLGFHVIATCDTYNNVNRFLSKKAFSEFEMRVLFQMSANDSANLIDNPKAGTLGLHRALFYNEQEGYLETFRPYALPDSDWLEQAAKNLKRLLAS
ncbi:MAG: segregation ATPase, FtsK/SpoIIIE family [Pedosphaera sp.]|nr:segregation ATPase, FtsK/SpoIIIE family [Pedosphaera sp.]